MKKDFAINKLEMSKKFDKNGDGKLSEAEIDTLTSDLTAKPEGGKGKGDKEGKRNKRR